MQPCFRLEEIDAVLISTDAPATCVPASPVYVSESLGLRQDIFALDLVGYKAARAALPNLRAADAILAARSAKKALSICVEICSAAFYMDDDLSAF